MGLLRLLVVMLTSPAFLESVLPTENVLIVSFSAAFPYSGGLNFIVFAFSVMSPPFPELPDPELDLESRDCVSILPLMVDIEISPPFPETERAETEPSVLSILILPALPLPPLLFSTYPSSLTTNSPE